MSISSFFSFPPLSVALDSIICHYNHYLGKTLNPQYSACFLPCIPLAETPCSLHWRPSGWMCQRKTTQAVWFPFICNQPSA